MAHKRHEMAEGPFFYLEFILFEKENFKTFGKSIKCFYPFGEKEENEHSSRLN